MPTPPYTLHQGVKNMSKTVSNSAIVEQTTQQSEPLPDPVLLVSKQDCKAYMPNRVLSARIHGKVAIYGQEYWQLTPPVWAELFEKIERLRDAVLEGRVPRSKALPVCKRFVRISTWAMQRYGEEALNQAVARRRDRGQHAA